MSTAASEYLESQKSVHPDLQDQYAQLAELYRKKYVLVVWINIWSTNCKVVFVFFIVVSFIVDLIKLGLWVMHVYIFNVIIANLKFLSLSMV